MVCDININVISLSDEGRDFDFKNVRVKSFQNKKKNVFNCMRNKKKNSDIKADINHIEIFCIVSAFMIK